MPHSLPIILRVLDASFALFGKLDMSSKPKSFREFSLECKNAQRSTIRKERERMDQAEQLWGEYFLAFFALGLKPMTDRDITKRRDELDRMAASVDEQYGDNESMRAAYEIYLKATPPLVQTG